ncbi:MAG: RagB/SusD family nutrient uptake outer membrane protein [Tannerella sp.]|jgi:hypothetical protein|nr:RagB/SusD family nutrient uptake outer membrane protein [Tannerella sp.]
MNYKKNIFIVKCLLVGVFFTVSCNSDILNYDDPNNIDTQTYFKTPEQIREAANATYVGILTERMFGGYWHSMFDVMVNEAAPTANAEAVVIPFWRFEYNSSNQAILNLWRMCYRIILRANLTIDMGEAYLAEHGDENEMVKQSIGEAHFLRGWAYWQLAFHYGRVPLRLTYEQGGNEHAPRANTVEEVWEVAEADFKAAQTVLPVSWDSKSIGRATSGAATGFLGKLYLYTKKYAEAEAEFAKMTPNYSLLPGDQWLDLFGEARQNGVESVFEIQFQHYNGEGTSWYLNDLEDAATVYSRNTMHPRLYSWAGWNNWYFPAKRKYDFIYADEAGNEYIDPRAALTFYEPADGIGDDTDGIGDDTWCDFCPAPGGRPFTQTNLSYKKILNAEYKVSEDALASNNNVQMRYADVLLMRAECALLGPGSDVAKALGFINEVRRRIGAFEYQRTYTADQAFELLVRERNLELMGEHHRFNDLKRWGILKETMDPELIANGATPMDPKYYMFPIPLQEIEVNLAIETPENGWN